MGSKCQVVFSDRIAGKAKVVSFWLPRQQKAQLCKSMSERKASFTILGSNDETRGGPAAVPVTSILIEDAHASQSRPFMPA
jgi:hypothetical protein